MDNKEKKYTILFIPVITLTSVINGIVSGLMSVITAYFFKPIWEKIVINLLDAKQNYWNKKQ